MINYSNRLLSKLFRVLKVIRGKDFFIKKDIKCNHITYGNKESAWTFCPDLLLLNENSIIYSFGIGIDVSFDIELINNFDVFVYAFDPTPKSIKWVKKQNLPKQFILHEYGLANFNGKAKFHPPENPKHVSATMLERPETKNEAYKVNVKTLDVIMSELKHNHIDLLKLSIEGAEYLVIDDFLSKNIKPKQLLIEFHHSFKNVDIKTSKTAIKKLRKSGYQIFYISTNGEKISFILSEKLKH